MTHNTREVEEIEEHDMTPFEARFAQAILAALEYRGFYDCEKYLDTTVVKRIRPLLSEYANFIQQETLKDVCGGIFARCCELRLEIERQEDEHGRRDEATANRLSEAERIYAGFKESENGLELHEGGLEHR